jgi:hypothetical protein
MARRETAEYFMWLALVIWFAGRICEFVVHHNTGGLLSWWQGRRRDAPS